MTQDELIRRLELIRGDINRGFPAVAECGLAQLVHEIKAEGIGSPAPPAPAPRRSPLADLPRGSKITIEVG